MLAPMGLLLAVPPAKGGSPSSATWPQGYSVKEAKTAVTLTLSTPFSAFQHDFKRGGAISRITLTHGKATNLLVRPIETRVRDRQDVVFSDLNDPAPKVTHGQAGLNEIVVVESVLADEQGRGAGLRVKSTFEYRWGYVKIRKELVVPPGGFAAREICPFATVLAPNLSEYGYREGVTEEDGAPPFSFGSNRWRKLRPGHPEDSPLQIRFVPRSVIFADPGVEGLEWFVGSDLAQWDVQLAGRRGQAQCSVAPSQGMNGLAVSVAPFWSSSNAITLTKSCVFDYYLAVPLLEGQAQKPWVHTSFNRNKGTWVSPDEIRNWAEQGYQTAHCHNDGDYYDDGLFWRDGAYPPYPDMDGYDRVLKECRKIGIRTATYFSNKELHPSTREFQEHGLEWGRMNRKGDLQHNFFRGQSEFGAQMCLRSGWLGFLKLSIDRVLKNHPLDGVYYDWNVALLCCNPLHEGKGSNTTAQGHWDIDELLDLMEWTRQRVGPDGLVIVHNTTTPMFAAENFANHIVATEWGYQKWINRAPDLQDLPLEWSLAGARSRGVISYGTIDTKAPRALHRLFALEAFLGGVTPWPASPETFELLPLFKPLGDVTKYRFADWRNQSVTLSDKRCASAVFSRPGEAYVLLANLDQEAKEVTCTLHPEKLPHPLKRLKTATRLGLAQAAEDRLKLDVRQWTGEGLRIPLAGADATLIHIQ
jgi:hypothetical protein